MAKIGTFEYEVEYSGGPADGLTSFISVPSSSPPPDLSYLELHSLVEIRSPLGKHVFNHCPSDRIRVAVYSLESMPYDFEKLKDVLYYNFIRMASYSDIKHGV